jgi:hypothetical protein
MRHRTVRRFGVVAATALAATMLTPVGAGVSQEFSLVVEATDEDRFTASDNWETSSWNSQAYGDEYYFATPDTTASDAAWYSADIPAAGTYWIEVWYPANSGYNNATPFVINTANGSQFVHVNQRSNGGRWVSIGVHSLAAGDGDVVGVSRWTTGTG